MGVGAKLLHGILRVNGEGELKVNRAWEFKKMTALKEGVESNDYIDVDRRRRTSPHTKQGRTIFGSRFDVKMGMSKVRDRIQAGCEKVFRGLIKSNKNGVKTAREETVEDRGHTQSAELVSPKCLFEDSLIDGGSRRENDLPMLSSGTEDQEACYKSATLIERADEDVAASDMSSGDDWKTENPEQELPRSRFCMTAEEFWKGREYSCGMMRHIAEGNVARLCYFFELNHPAVPQVQMTSTCDDEGQMAASHESPEYSKLQVVEAPSCKQVDECSDSSIETVEPSSGDMLQYGLLCNNDLATGDMISLSKKNCHTRKHGKAFSGINQPDMNASCVSEPP